MGVSSSQLASIMRSLFIVSLILGFSMSAPDMRMTCEECVREMHSLGRIVKEGAPAIVEYLRGNYCPTVHDVEECEQHLVKYYVGQLFAIVEHYFIDGALMSVRPQELVVSLKSTLVMSALRALNGCKLTCWTRS